MQFKFLIAFVLMGACLIQATSAQPSIDLLKGPIDNALDNAHKIFEKVLALIQEKVQEALNTLNELKYKVTEQVGEAINAMKQKLEELIEKARLQIEDIKKKAEQAGIDISNCIAESEGRFNEMLENLLADEINCVTKEVNEVMRIIEETVQMMTDTVDSIKNFPNNLKDCVSNSKPITCIIHVNAELIELQKDLPLKITKKVQEVTEFVAGLQTRLETCAISQLANAGIAAAGVVGEVVKCAAEKGLEQVNL